MNKTILKTMLTRHEGRKTYIYKDTMGYLTGGIGHLITKADGPLKERDTITDAQIDAWFERDVDEAIKIAKIYLSGSFDTLNEARQICIANLAYNLGPKLYKFKTLKAALLMQEYDQAADAMENSNWYHQVKGRAVELVSIMRTGVI